MHYVIAPRRGRESEAQTDWQTAVTAIPGVRVIGASARRLHIASPRDVTEDIRRLTNGVCLVEVTLDHHYDSKDGHD